MPRISYSERPDAWDIDRAWWQEHLEEGLDRADMTRQKWAKETKESRVVARKRMDNDAWQNRLLEHQQEVDSIVLEHIDAHPPAPIAHCRLCRPVPPKPVRPYERGG